MECYESAAALVAACPPERPVLCLRPHAARRAARWFCENFPGTVLYALKANDAPVIAQTLNEAGIQCFDVASPREMAAVARLPSASMSLMHPIKSRETIRAAYFDYGIRTFALDTPGELAKILEVTNGAGDLTLFVRIACSNADSLIPLEGKFGVGTAEAPSLLVHARRAARRLGVTFHVGSQAMVPTRFSQALADVGTVVSDADVVIEHVDIGGGFPSCYPGIEPPELSNYLADIQRGLTAIGERSQVSVSCEPGRALVAEAESLLVRVEARRGHSLYINDGAFGTLYDAAHSGFTYPARLVGPTMAETGLDAFILFGPTCDSADRMPGPYMLPATITEGDYIEIGQVGAYGRTLATRFNGFGTYDEAELLDAPMMSMYAETSHSDRGFEQTGAWRQG